MDVPVLLVGTALTDMAARPATLASAAKKDFIDEVIRDETAVITAETAVDTPRSEAWLH